MRRCPALSQVFTFVHNLLRGDHSSLIVRIAGHRSGGERSWRACRGLFPRQQEGSGVEGRLEVAGA